MFLRQNPFVKLLIPFASGILIQWYLQPPGKIGVLILLIGGTLYSFFSLLKGFARWKYSWLSGAGLGAAMLAVGMLLAYIKDVRNHPLWMGHHYSAEQAIVAVLQEFPVEKERSYKAEAQVQYCIAEDSKQKVRGRIIIYFSKDSCNAHLKAGDQLLFQKSLQEIRNTGNPGAFDYKRYALFNEITHTIYLTDTEYVKLSENNISAWKKLIFKMRSYVLQTIRQYIKDPKEQGLAEAMLIGYREDLDKELLQAYTNTGVVHVIAVSGMHLAMLYWVINIVLQPLLRKSTTRWLHTLLVLLILWSFAFVAGGAASVVRAAVMFTFITIGRQINRNTSIYNILAAAAFFQLCYNPYWLWNAGFQLSYMAVLSIVVFYKPIYNLLYVRNEILNKVWQLASVSMAAQILTTPLALYNFHQFPIYFLLANLVVVPASSMVLVGTLLLTVIAPVRLLAVEMGKILEGLIWWLNSFIEIMGTFPLAVWSGIQIGVGQTVLLYIVIAAMFFWLREKNKAGLWTALAAIFLFWAIRAWAIYEVDRQRKIVVYHIPRYGVMDFIGGRNFYAVGDNAAFQDFAVQTFTLHPARTFQRVRRSEVVAGFSRHGNAIIFQGKKVLWINEALNETNLSGTIPVDIVVFSGNTRITTDKFFNQLTPKHIVADGSVPAGKARYWKRVCDSLQVPFHYTVADGAFVMNF